mgnify:CR=1 FL=1
MAISTVSQKGLDAPLTLTAPVLNSPVISGTPTGSLVSANMPTGSVIQVVSTITTSYSYSTTAGFTDVTGMTATITPQFSTTPDVMTRGLASQATQQMAQQAAAQRQAIAQQFRGQPGAQMALQRQADIQSRLQQNPLLFQAFQQQQGRELTQAQQQQAAAEAYQQNVFEALRPAEINGLKLDKKTQAQLYSGLVQPQYPSITGKPTNLLGHLLEKYQFVEPNHGLIAEALWLLADPDGYKSKIKEQGSKAATEKTVRMLKTEEARKSVSSTNTDDNDGRSNKRTLQRPGNMFKRF